MKKVNMPKLVGTVSLLFLFLLILTIIFIRPAIFAASDIASGTATPAVARNAPGTPPQLKIQQHRATPTIAPTPTPTPMPTTAPQPTATQAASTSSTNDRYFPVGTSLDAIKAGGANLSKQQVKTLIESQVDEHWSVIANRLGFTAKEQGYAFFLGMATRESTLNAGLETGSGASHSYGPLQASETAYANANPLYSPENDVPEMTQYDFTPENYYDPGISVHMGIRHLLHFADLAVAAGYSGTEMLRHALIGYNTGDSRDTDPDLLLHYSDEIGSLAGWYLNNGHFYDAEFTWTTDPRVDRSKPWGWY